ncbi:MAG: DegT/DnrJ/EryC1/StrS family aminotransferase, partial [Kiritimatiellaeota bacterium]|nr:DegT/DnrJ/EryC1/StrS family aminotransferase [Kiritimatiellota bacterium]
GEKAKTVPYGTGKRFGKEELRQLEEALEQNTLFYWSGQKTRQFREKFAAMYGMPYCTTASSGTAAIHTALGTVGVGPGDEVMTSPITDMGSVIGIVLQNAIPVFADLDAHTYNLDPKSVAARITDKTKAIVVVHLAGNPADMDAINAIATPRGIKVIEDCAQSYLCRYKGRLAGTLGDIGCFSLNDFKHISAGDGGMCLVHDEATYQRATRFADKNYNRFSGNMRDIPFIAPNYRINELTSAVALAQLDKLEAICAKRTAYGDALTAGLQGLPGITPHKVEAGNVSSYWFYMLRIDEAKAGVSRDRFAEALAAEGVAAGAGYIPACVYEYDMFKNLSGFENTRAPFDSPYYGKTIDYPKGLCPVAERILETAVRVTVNEFFTPQDLEETIAGIRKVSAHFM